MKHFDFSRFMNVARWDLTVNRPFYTRVLLVIGSVIMLPVLMRYISALWKVVYLGGNREAYILANATDSMEGTVVYQTMAIGIIMVVLMGYIFHNLLTRQSRINELTLPSTNLERFLWHVGLTIVGGYLACLVSLVVSDLIHVILGWAILGQTSFSSLTMKVLDPSELDINLYAEELTADEDFHWGALYSAFSLVSLINYSFFALGNAWKYKGNIVYTLLWMIGASLAGTILMGFVVSMLARYFESTYQFGESLGEFFKNLSITGNQLLIAINVLELLLLGLIWWLTYRLYCRAQITTRRNP